MRTYYEFLAEIRKYPYRIDTRLILADYMEENWERLTHIGSEGTIMAFANALRTKDCTSKIWNELLKRAIPIGMHGYNVEYGFFTKIRCELNSFTHFVDWSSWRHTICAGVREVEVDYNYIDEMWGILLSQQKFNDYLSQYSNQEIDQFNLKAPATNSQEYIAKLSVLVPGKLLGTF